VSQWDPGAEDLLRRRAEQLAKRVDTEEEARHDVEVLICRLGGERYAIETRTLRAVLSATGLTRVPSTPAYVLGIVSVRGEIVTLLDLATMIGLTHQPAERTTCSVLLLGLAGLRCGLVVDEVLEVERIRMDALEPSISGREFTRGLAPGPTVVLDVEQLMASGRFSVAEEVI